MPRAVEHFLASGHPEVTATHRSTFEITAEDHLTPAGSCIIAVRSEKGAADLSPEFKTLMQTPGSSLTTVLTCDDVTVTIISTGSPALSLEHPADLVWRRSSFTCSRTLGTFASHTAATLPRELIDLLRKERSLDITLTVEADPSLPHESDPASAGFQYLMSK